MADAGRAAGVCVIPARGGSRRLPRKNVLPFLGRPMLAWPVAAAIASGAFAAVVVSTEDEEIAAAATAAGARVDARPAALAGDRVGVVEVCLDFLEREHAAGRGWETLCVVYATAVLCAADDIRATVDLLEPGRCDFAMAVTRYEHYPHLALCMDAQHRLTPQWPDLLEAPAPARPAVVCNGTVMAAATQALRRSRSFYGQPMRGHLMPAARSVDIDTADDLALATYYAQRARAGVA